MDDDKTVTAHFTEDNYTLNIAIEGSGSVSKNPDQENYKYGTNVELTAKATYGWYLAYWSGDLTGRKSPITINMTSDKSITAHFNREGGGGGPIPPSDSGGDSNPTADANGPYYGFPGEEIQFNGSESHDNDENGQTIERYDWKFFDGDEWHNDSGATPTYTYTEIGQYTVTLRVYDDEDQSDENTTTVIITQANNPPQNLKIIGANKGDQNISYNYDVSAIDLDGDNITYTINWDDGNSITSNPLPSGDVFSSDHMWTEAGIYTITVYAEDELNTPATGTASLEVLIDVIYVKTIGYLIDYDSDGIYDEFYSNSTKAKTITEQTEDNKYLINSNEDEDWDWIYDPETDTLEPYFYEAEDYTLWYILLLLILICLLAALIYFSRKRKKQEEVPPKSK
jgi:PKD repeat protein